MMAVSGSPATDGSVRVGAGPLKRACRKCASNPPGADDAEHADHVGLEGIGVGYAMRQENERTGTGPVRFLPNVKRDVAIEHVEVLSSVW
jgi:hypothetical protein